MEEDQRVVRIRNDGRPAAPRWAEEEATDAPVIADEAASRLGRRERTKQVRPVLAGNRRVEVDDGRQVGRLVRADTWICAAIRQAGRLKDPVVGLDDEPERLVERLTGSGGDQEEGPAVRSRRRVDRPT